MRIEYYKEYSRHLRRDMEFKVFGYAGKPCITFPCQDKRFFDYEDHGMIDRIRSFIDSGKIQVFCCDSVDIDTWSAKWKYPWDRIGYQEAYFYYVTEELVPRVLEINGSKDTGILVYGCSMGAYHAMNFFLRRPDVFDGVLALSGIYHCGYFIENFSNELTFLNSPIDSLRYMKEDHRYVELYKKAVICVCVGGGSWEEQCIIDSKDLEKEFLRLSVPVRFEYWGMDIPHDWCSWLEQTPYFLNYILK